MLSLAIAAALTAFRGFDDDYYSQLKRINFIELLKFGK